MFVCVCVSACTHCASLYTLNLLNLCVCVCVSVITHQVHSGGSFTQGHADPGGCVSDNLMIHLLQSDFVSFCEPEGPDASSLTDLASVSCRRRRHRHRCFSVLAAASAFL